MIFVPFPALDADERLAHRPDVDIARVRVAPGAAVKAADVGDLDGMRLIAGPEGPIYVLRRGSRPMIAVDATGTETLAPVSPGQAGRIAADFAGQPVRVLDGPFDYDQWIVHQRFDPYRPFFRAAVADKAGTELYVSARSGEVVQKTTRSARAWNYAGAVVHWIYPTVLRQSWVAWDVTVWSLSLVGLVMAVAGLTLGIVRSARSLNVGSMGDRRTSTWSAFHGWMRWHHLIGLAGGVILITWTFSGWLSMDHGLLFSTGEPRAETVARYRGLSMAAASEAVSMEQFVHAAPFKELEIVAVDGRGWLVMRGANRGSTRVLPVDDTAATPLPVFSDEVLLAASRRAWPAPPARTFAPIFGDDAYNPLTSKLPETTRRIVIESTPPLWIHVDAASGNILAVLDRSRRVYRWLFNGLHNFDLPGVATNNTLRIAIMLPLLGLGFALSLTGVIIGVRRLAGPNS
jgi:hypothetical protein